MYSHWVETARSLKGNHMNNLVKLMALTGKLVAEAEKNFGKIQKKKVPKLLQEKAKPMMDRHEKLKKEFVEWKRAILMALLATKPVFEILQTKTDEGWYRIFSDEVEFNWKDENGYHQFRSSIDNLVKWDSNYPHFIATCNALITRMVENPKTLNEQIKTAAPIARAIEAIAKKTKK